MIPPSKRSDQGLASPTAQSLGCSSPFLTFETSNETSACFAETQAGLSSAIFLWDIWIQHIISPLYLCPKALLKCKPSPFSFYILETQNPRGSPFSIAPLQLAQPPLSAAQSPGRAEGASSDFLGCLCPEHVCLRFPPGCPSLPAWGGLFSTGFLFPLRTPCVCVALSPRHNAPLHFLGRQPHISAERSRRGRGSPEGIGDTQSLFSR